ncbi:activating molecule in BECN1-regulated autophagy protein 1-like isoform X2 [Convolutriloba macropyga]
MENALSLKFGRNNHGLLNSVLRGRSNVADKGRQSDIEKALDHRNISASYDHKDIDVPSDSRTTFACCFSPDGTLLASSHGDHKIYISRVDTLSVLHVLKGHARTPWCLAWHPDPQRKLLASGCLGGVTSVWQIAEPVVKESWKPVSIDALSGKLVSSVAFHPVRQREVVIAMANCILFWDWHMQAPYRMLTTQNPAERISVVTFDPLSRCMITAISNAHTPTISEVVQNTINARSTPNDPTGSLRPITIDIINTGYLCPRTQEQPNRTRAQNASTQTDPVAVSVGTSTTSPLRPRTRRTEADATEQLSYTLDQPTRSYNLRPRDPTSRAARSPKKSDFDQIAGCSNQSTASSEVTASANEGSQHSRTDETEIQQSSSSLKRKTRQPRKANTRSNSRLSKRAKISQTSVGTNTEAEQAPELEYGTNEVSTSINSAPSAIRASVYFSDFPNYPAASAAGGPVFPLSNSDPHGAIFHSHFPRNFVRLQTEPLNQADVTVAPETAESLTVSSAETDSTLSFGSSAVDDPAPSLATAEESSQRHVPADEGPANPEASFGDGTTTSNSHDNPAQYLRIAVVHCAANQTTSLVSRLQSQATVPVDNDSGYRISVRIHPPIDRDISISSGAYGVRVDSERRSAHEIDPPTRELSTPDMFANRVIDTLRSALNTQIPPPPPPRQRETTAQPEAAVNRSNPSFTVVTPARVPNLPPPPPPAPEITNFVPSPTNAHNTDESDRSMGVTGSDANASRPPSTLRHRITLGRIVELELGEVTNSQRAQMSRVNRDAESFHNLDNPRVPPASQYPAPLAEPHIEHPLRSEAVPGTSQRLATFMNAPPESNNNFVTEDPTAHAARHPRQRARRGGFRGPSRGIAGSRDVNGTHHIYDISVFDSRLRPNEAIEDAITRVAFGAFAVTGDYMRAQQRVSYRLQFWTDLSCPAIHNPNMNVLVKKCKVLNQTALSISKDGSILALLTSHDSYDFEETFLSVYDFNTLIANANPLAKIPVGNNAISVSLSPSSNYVFVGYYNKPSTRSLFFRNFLNGPSLGEIFEFTPCVRSFTKRLIPRKQLNQPTTMSRRESRFRGSGAGSSNEDVVGSVNCASWLPVPGSGLVYGTTLGELIVCEPKRPKFVRDAGNVVPTERPDESSESMDSPSDLLMRLGRDNFELMDVDTEDQQSTEETS